MQGGSCIYLGFSYTSWLSQKSGCSAAAAAQSEGGKEKQTQRFGEHCGDSHSGFVSLDGADPPCLHSSHVFLGVKEIVADVRKAV